MISQEFFDSLILKIDSTPNKEELEDLITEALQPLLNNATERATKVQSDIENKLAKIQPYIDIVQGIIEAISGFSVSLDPTAIITLVVDAIAQPLKQLHIKIQECMRDIQPATKVYEESVASLNFLSTNVGNVKSHIQAKANKNDWDISLPTTPIPTIPDGGLSSILSAIKTADSSLSAITGLPPVNEE